MGLGREMVHIKRILYSSQQKIEVCFNCLGSHWKHIGCKYGACCYHVQESLERLSSLMGESQVCYS